MTRIFKIFLSVNNWSVFGCVFVCVSFCVHKVGADILFLIPRIKDCIDCHVEETRHERKSSLSRLTSSMENSLFCLLPIGFWSAPPPKKKTQNHCELSWVQSIAALPMHLGSSISNLRPRNPDCCEPAEPKC